MERSTAEKMLFSAVLLCVYIHTLYDRYILLLFLFPPTISTNIKRRHGRRDFSLFSFSPLKFDLVEKTRAAAAAASSSRSFLFCLSLLPSSSSYYRKSQKSIEWKEKKKKSPIKRADRPLGCLSFFLHPRRKSSPVKSTFPMRIYGHPLLFFSPALLLAMLEREVFSFSPNRLLMLLFKQHPTRKKRKKKGRNHLFSVL